MFDADGKAWLLELNCSPSLAIDSVYPSVGPYACTPSAMPSDSPFSLLHAAALRAMGSKGRQDKTCTCMSHHRPHVHTPCLVDLAAKYTLLRDTLTIVRRDVAAAKHAKEVTAAELAEGTAMVVVHDQ
jgi:hypothetical protein